MEYAYPSTISPVKTKVRKAVRQMLLCAVVIAIAILFMDADGMPLASRLFLSAMGGIVLCPVPWLIYKFARFVIGR